ncbi:MAG: tRNA (adenosine(37)-N6)-threonylcarbamoyltransferase complex ATPase subunit type 1 TsaE [Patescibacteria group bacterium]
MNFISHSSSETKSIGRQIAATLTGGEVVLLSGELGAGKTTLVKGMAEFFGISEGEITSPTFTLLNIHEITGYSDEADEKKSSPNGKITGLAHIDTYRLKNEKELLEIGAEDYLGDPSCLTIIEWPEKINNLLKGKKLRRIILKHLDEETREISME